MSATFDELASLAEALSVLGHATPRSFDAIAAFGEQLSSHLVAAFFKLRGIPAEHVDARDVFMTDDNFMAAEPQTDAIAEGARDIVQPMIEDGKVPVMGGFIGRTAGGITHNSGAAEQLQRIALGAALHAEAIEIGRMSMEC